MTDLFWPAILEPGQSDFRLRDLSGRFVSPITGTARTYSRAGGQLVTASLTLPTLTGQRKAAMQALVAGLRGGVNRIWLRDHSYTRRGSFAATELLSNNTFLSGTTGWTAGSSHSAAVTDRVYRAKRTGNLGAVASGLYDNSAETVTSYAPYCARAFVVAGRGTYTDLLDIRLGSAALGTEYAQSTAQDPGYLVAAGVPYNNTAFFTVAELVNASLMAGDYLDVFYTSLARCALIDARPNVLTYSDTFTNAAWSNTRSSDAADAIEAPDGSTTADSIREDTTATSTHYIQQTESVGSGAADYCFSVCLKAGTRTFARVAMVESTGSDECYVDVNLSTGALGTATASGTNWTEPRAFTTSLGNGWYRIAIVGRKVSAGTTLTARLYLASALGTVSYTGGGTTQLIYAWRGGLAQSSVPFNPSLTAAAEVTGSAQSGTGLYVKGLPASSSGLLLPGDQVQIGNDLLFVSESLDSDSAGLGFLKLHRPLRGTVADNAPVIVAEPHGKFMLADPENGWTNNAPAFADSTLNFVEAVD